MDPSELRIGNLVYLKSKKTVYEISSGHDIDEIESSGDALPVKLNGAWLTHLGFMENERADIATWWRPGWVINKDARGNWFVVKDKKVIINDVHRLQNLFYDIEGHYPMISKVK